MMNTAVVEQDEQDGSFIEKQSTHAKKQKKMMMMMMKRKSSILFLFSSVLPSVIMSNTRKERISRSRNGSTSNSTCRANPSQHSK